MFRRNPQDAHMNICPVMGAKAISKEKTYIKVIHWRVRETNAL